MPPREDPKRIGSPSPPPSQDELSFLNLVPAIFVCALVSAASYISCESVELSEDILIAVIRNFVQLSALAALLSPLFRCVGDHHSSRKSPLLVMAYVFFFMLPIAAYEASSRSKFTLHPSNTSSFYNDNLVLLVVLLSRKSLIYPFSLSFLNNLSNLYLRSLCGGILFGLHCNIWDTTTHTVVQSSPRDPLMWDAPQ